MIRWAWNPKPFTCSLVYRILLLNLFNHLIERGLLSKPLDAEIKGFFNA